MDYVVFGIGFGATILVLGLLVRDLGPHLRYRESSDGDRVLHAEELVGKVAWSRFCVALGSVLAIAGALFVIVTIACMLLVLSDETGRWVMLGTLATTLLVVLFWTWAFFDRFGSYGILPERHREREQPAPAPVAEPVAATVTPVTGPIMPGPQAPVAAADQEKLDDAGPEPEPVGTGEPAEPADAEAATDEPVAATQPGGGAASGEEAESPLQTPEERLARLEAPMNHGSAEGDLDIAATGPKRRTPRGARPARAVSDDEPPEPVGAPDRNDTTETVDRERDATDNGSTA